MRPTLSPGDFVLVDTRRYTKHPIQRGDVILAKHPYQSSLLIKRVSEVTDSGVMVEGDNPLESSDSRSFGELPHGRILGHVTSRIS